ncbi:MAG: RidA family protein [Lachnospiraceae bacterium]
MITTEIIHTDDAPKAIGPYSQAVRAGDLLYTSGQIPVNPATGEIVEGGIKEQTRQVMENLGAVLKAGNSSYEKAIKTTCFLADIDDFVAFNTVYAEYFTGKPARSCVAVKTLPKNVLCEVEVIAAIDDEINY